jgi:hypothetical protein
MHESLFLPIPLHADPIIMFFPVTILVTTFATCSYMMLLNLTHDLSIDQQNHAASAKALHKLVVKRTWSMSTSS